MGISLSTSFPNCVTCNFDCKSEIKICLEAYDNLETLRSRNDHLIKCEEDLQERIFQAADLLNNWVQEAKKVSGEIESMLKLETKNCCFCCHRYKFGTSVITKLKMVDDLQSRLGQLDIPRKRVEKSEIEQLRKGIDEILAKKVDLERKFPTEQLTEEVTTWSKEVDLLCQQGQDIAQGPNGADYHHFRALVDETVKKIGGLQEQHSKWDDKNIVVDKPQSVVEKPSWYSPHLKGMESKVNEVLEYLRGDRFFIIRIFGDGGIGKTTLLTEINSALYRESSNNCFSKVIFVTVSQKWSISEIQDQIASRLGLSNDERFHKRSVEEKAVKVFDALGRESFLLLLDDVWEELELAKIGIRQPTKCSKRSKIVFTSRIGSMCSDIGVDKTIQMNPLKEDPSWELFSEAAGGNGKKNLPEVAREVASLCGGLPLALKVIGRAVADLERREEWEDAVRLLRKSTGGHVSRETEEKVYKVLRYSFDRLENEVTKYCFLFCLVFGQSQRFDKEKLVDYWIGEGLLPEDQNSTLESLRSEGRHVLRTLVQACLLQKVDVESLSTVFDRRKYLRMHDMIYSMATRIDSLKGVGRTLVIKNAEERRQAMIRTTRANITQSGGKVKALELCSPYLTTLLYTGVIADDIFFDPLHSMRVLDLLDYGGTRLPSSICSLMYLRSLYLSHSSIHELPEELGQLVNLVLLDLSDTWNLRSIPEAGVSPLVNLLSLNLYGSWYSLPYDGDKKQGQLSLHDLEELPRLEELMLPAVRSAKALDPLSTMPRLSKSIRKLWLRGEMNPLSLPVGHLGNLESLRMEDFTVKKSTMVSGSRDWNALEKLRELTISWSPNISAVDMSWLLCKLPNLELLSVGNCHQLEKLLCLSSDDGAPSTVDCLSKLKVMELIFLPELSSIADGHLAFTSLVKLQVIGCPKLKNLSFPFVERDQKIRVINNPGWWENLEWADNGVKSMFTPVTLFAPWG